MFGKKNLSEEMKEKAVSLGLCAQWTSEWERNSSIDEMVEKFVKGIDFCIAKNWPTVDIIKRYFGEAGHKRGVYADENVSLKNPKMLILNGECVANIEYEWMDSGEIYVRHNSSLHLKAKGLSRVFVNLHNDAEVHIEVEDSARVFVYQYGGKVVEAKGDVTVRDRHNFKFK